MRGGTGNGDAAWPIRQVHPHRLTGRYGFSKDGVGDIKRSERLGGLADRGRKPESARETAEQGCARTGWCKARWGQSRGFRNAGGGSDDRRERFAERVALNAGDVIPETFFQTDELYDLAATVFGIVIGGEFSLARDPTPIRSLSQASVLIYVRVNECQP